MSQTHIDARDITKSEILSACDQLNFKDPGLVSYLLWMRVWFNPHFMNHGHGVDITDPEVINDLVLPSDIVEIIIQAGTANKFLLAVVNYCRQNRFPNSSWETMTSVDLTITKLKGLQQILQTALTAGSAKTALNDVI